MVLIYVSLRMDEVQFLYKLLVILSSTCLNILAVFLGCLSFSFLICRSCLYILDMCTVTTLIAYIKELKNQSPNNILDGVCHSPHGIHTHIYLAIFFCHFAGVGWHLFIKLYIITWILKTEKQLRI